MLTHVEAGFLTERKLKFSREKRSESVPSLTSNDIIAGNGRILTKCTEIIWLYNGDPNYRLVHYSNDN